MSKLKFKPGDKVRVLDGSNIPDYTHAWGMPDAVGKIYTIKNVGFYSNGYVGYALKEYQSECVFDERGLELVNEHTEKQRQCLSVVDVRVKKPLIIIKWSDGVETTAQCNEKDTFDIEKGVYVAISKRVLSAGNILEVIEKARNAQHYNGRIVCIKTSFKNFTVGKIYNVVNGTFIDDNGDEFGKYESFKHLRSRLASEFIEIVE